MHDARIEGEQSSQNDKYLEDQFVLRFAESNSQFEHRASNIVPRLGPRYTGQDNKNIRRMIT